MKRIFPHLLIIISTLSFFSGYFLKGHVSVPADILVGHYYPWKDYIWDDKTAGYPINNFHFYDQITQNYPWKIFTIEMYKKGNFPLWNPYNLTGVPHIANLPTASLYPGNILFFILPFITSWNILVLSQLILASYFMYYYLSNLKLNGIASLIGALSFSLSSFLSTTYEFLVIGHTFLWVPLSLLAIDKVCKKFSLKWWTAGIFSVSMMILGGHLQAFIYGFLIITIYTLFRIWEGKDAISKPKKTLTLLGLILIPLMLTSIQLIPLADTLLESSRITGYGKYEQVIGKNTFPIRRLVTLFIPDFFGNPATGNFWEEISYFEYAIYVGVIPALLALYTFFQRKTRLVKFWQIVLIVAFIFMLNTPIARIPYALNIPGYSSLIPVRLISLVSLSMPILAAFGITGIIKGDKRDSIKFLKIIISAVFLFSLLLLAVILKPDNRIWPGLENNAIVALRNSVIPGILLLISFFGISFAIKNRGRKMYFVVALLVIATAFDLLRQAKKFNTFVPEEIIYPQTQTLNYLNDISPPPRVMISHTELLPANTNLPYGFAKITGYDSIHSKRTEDLLKVLNAQDLDARNSIPTRDLYVGNYLSKAINLVSPEYIFALEGDFDVGNFEPVASDGKTKLYKNPLSYPRVYLTQDIIYANNEVDALGKTLSMSQEGIKGAVVEENVSIDKSGKLDDSKADIIEYEPNKVVVKSESDAEALLVFNDAFDNGWKAKVNSRPSEILRVNYAFRGIKLTAGKNVIEFSYQPKSFAFGVIISTFSLTLLIILIIYAQASSQTPILQAGKRRSRKFIL